MKINYQRYPVNIIELTNDSASCCVKEKKTDYIIYVQHIVHMIAGLVNYTVLFNYYTIVMNLVMKCLSGQFQMVCCFGYIVLVELK